MADHEISVLVSILKALLLDGDGNGLEGQIPTEGGGIAALQVLDVSKSNLNDVITREIGRYQNLSVVVLADLAGDREEFSGSKIES